MEIEEKNKENWNPEKLLDYWICIEYSSVNYVDNSDIIKIKD